MLIPQRSGISVTILNFYWCGVVMLSARIYDGKVQSHKVPPVHATCNLSWNIRMLRTNIQHNNKSKLLRIPINLLHSIYVVGCVLLTISTPRSCCSCVILRINVYHPRSIQVQWLYNPGTRCLRQMGTENVPFLTSNTSTTCKQHSKTDNVNGIT